MNDVLPLDLLELEEEPLDAHEPDRPLDEELLEEELLDELRDPQDPDRPLLLPPPRDPPRKPPLTRTRRASMVQ